MKPSIYRHNLTFRYFDFINSSIFITFKAEIEQVTAIRRKERSVDDVLHICPCAILILSPFNKVRTADNHPTFFNELFRSYEEKKYLIHFIHFAYFFVGKDTIIYPYVVNFPIEVNIIIGLKPDENRAFRFFKTS